MTLFTIGGGSCSGKSSLANQCHRLFTGQHVFALSLDQYYDDTSHLTSTQAAQTNLDVPEAIDIGMALRDIEAFHAGNVQMLPQYDFVTRKRTFCPFSSPQPAILILEGLFALHHETLNAMSNCRIFVDASLEVMRARRLARDVRTRGTSEQEIIERYDTFIRKSYHTIILPTREHAQVIVDGEASIDMQLATLSAAVNGLS